jgi:peptidoglycan-associated lipoprotein
LLNLFNQPPSFIPMKPVRFSSVAATAENVSLEGRSRAPAWWVLVLPVVLAGCASGVSLKEDVPVTDRSGVSVNQAAGASTGAATSSAGSDTRAVAPVEVKRENLTEPPQQLSRLVYFDFDDYSVKPEFMTVVQQHARFLTADRKRRVVLEGHADERGGREYNLALGQRRADAVRRALGLLGVNDEQMESVSFGKEKPANPGGDEAAHSQNRRVELSYR